MKKRSIFVCGILIIAFAATTLFKQNLFGQEAPSTSKPTSSSQAVENRPSSPPSTQNAADRKNSAEDEAAEAMPIAELLADVGKALAWPLTLLIVVLLFAYHPRLNRLFGLTKAIRKIKAVG